MGMTFSVYIGPYVKAYGTRNATERELLDCFDDILQEGRGECGEHDCLYVVPSSDIQEDNGLGMTFDVYESDREPAAFTESMMRRQIEQMGNLANTFIAAVESCGGTCDVLWGVVCKMH